MNSYVQIATEGSNFALSYDSVGWCARFNFTWKQVHTQNCLLEGGADAEAIYNLC